MILRPSLLGLLAGHRGLESWGFLPSNEKTNYLVHTFLLSRDPTEEKVIQQCVANEREKKKTKFAPQKEAHETPVAQQLCPTAGPARAREREREQELALQFTHLLRRRQQRPVFPLPLLVVQVAEAPCGHDALVLHRVVVRGSHHLCTKRREVRAIDTREIDNPSKRSNKKMYTSIGGLLFLIFFLVFGTQYGGNETEKDRQPASQPASQQGEQARAGRQTEMWADLVRAVFKPRSTLTNFSR